MAEQIPTIAVKNMIESSNDNLSQQLDSETHLLRQKIDEWIRYPFDMDHFFELVESINSDDRFKQHFGTIGIRHLLSKANGPIQEVIDANLIPRLIQFAQNDTEFHLQFESIWALTNVACGTSQQTEVIIAKGGIPCFIKSLKSHKIDIVEQAIWAIGNISGDSSISRDMILKEGGLEPLLEAVAKAKDALFIKNSTWAISNLCRGKPLPDFELVKSAMPVLCKIIQQDVDIDTLVDAIWSLSYLTAQQSSISYELSIEILPVLLKYIDNASLSLSIPCIRTLGNITQDEAVQDAALADPSYLPKLMMLVCHNRNAVKREACWNLSNLTAGGSNQIEAFIKNHQYVDIIIKLAVSTIPQVHKEAVYILSNATKGCNLEQLAGLVDLGLIDCLIYNLKAKDRDILEIAVCGLKNILDMESAANQDKPKKEYEVLNLVIAKKGLKRLIRLHSHPNTDVKSKVKFILKNHFKEYKKKKD